MIHEKLKAFERFNEWERQVTQKPSPATCLAIVFELYQMIPAHARQRPVNVEGIIKMRKGLACLGSSILSS